MIKTENLINYIQSKISAYDSSNIIVVKQDISMDYEHKDPLKIYGIAKVTNGTIEPVPELKESTSTISIQFICPVERRKYLESVLSSAAQSVAGVVVSNSTIQQGVTGVTSTAFNFPQGQNYKISTMGETYSYNFFCYFIIDETSIQSNQCPLSVITGYEDSSYVLEKIIYSELQASCTFNSQTDTYSGDENSKTLITSTSKSISFTGIALSTSNFYSYLKDMLNGIVKTLSFQISLGDNDNIQYVNLIPSGPVIVKFVPGKAVYFSVSFVESFDSGSTPIIPE